LRYGLKAVGNIVFFGTLALLVSKCKTNELIPPAGINVNVNADSVVFAVIGDYGYDSDNEEDVAELVKSWDPHFIISLGDNNYPSGERHSLKKNISKYYADYIYNFDAPKDLRCEGKAFQDMENRFFPCPGNHDENPATGILNYLNYFTLPGEETYYTFGWGAINFYSLNSLAANVNDQWEWLKDEMAKSEQTFNIVFFHHSPYGTGMHSQAGWMRWDFDEMGVDVVMTGHDHIYSRIEKKGDQHVHYIINGLGGKSLYKCYVEKLPSESFDIKCFSDDFGAIRGISNGNRLVLEFFTVSDPYTPIDRLELIK
jgi:predicted phosphodiesterase